MRPATALTIAGSDPSGGAGIQADLKAFAAVGVHGASVVTAITAQDTSRVGRVAPLPPDLVESQLDAVFGDLAPRAAKSGLLHDEKTVLTVARRIAAARVPLVVDPVLRATSGEALSADDLPDAILRHLAPIATLLAPNLDEASTLSGFPVRTEADMRRAARSLHERGARTVLVKGGHLAATAASDVFYDGNDFEVLAAPRVAASLHGAGCTLSALITGLLAKGYSVRDAAREGKLRLSAAASRAYAPGGGRAVLDTLRVLPPFPQGLRDELVAVGLAALELCSFLPDAFVPEVGTNLAYGRVGARGPGDVAALDGRIFRIGEGPRVSGAPAAGASHHVATVVLAAMAHDPTMRAAVNLALFDDADDVARAAGLLASKFSRDREPPGGSTMDWGTREAIRNAGRVPDAVLDEGAPGKEAMVRILGRDPADVVLKVRRLSEAAR